MPLDHAILAFLQLKPRTGYDLKKYFDQSVKHFWSATQSHIYRSLNRLLECGWVRVSHVEQEGRPDRKVYHITSDGETELHQWLSVPRPLENNREGWLVQLFFAHQLSNEEIAHLLEARAEALRVRLKRYREEVQPSITRNYERLGIERARNLWQMTLDFGVVMQEAELQWLEQALETVQTLPALAPPEKE